MMTTLITNVEELAAHIGATEATEEAMSHRLYKDTECGAWLSLGDGDVTIGCTIEGSDAEVTPANLTFDFTDNAWALAIDRIEAEADKLWREANEPEAAPGIRLDNGNTLVIDWLLLDFDPENPGDTQPVDVCLDCVRVQFYDTDILDMEIYHPPYADV